MISTCIKDGLADSTDYVINKKWWPLVNQEYFKLPPILLIHIFRICIDLLKMLFSNFDSFSDMINKRKPK